jgi:PAS domain S-box-containing protein
LNKDELLQLWFAQTTDYGAILLDRQGTILELNSTAAAMFGYQPSELRGQPIHQLFIADDVRSGVPGYELQVASNSLDVNNDRWLRRSDGSTFWATGTTTGLHDSAGELVGFAKVLRNSTDVKEQIEALRERARNLGAINENKTLFLATLSHELRNPIASLTNALYLLERGGFTEKDRQYPIKLMARQVEFIRHLVDDLLDVTRIGAGTVQLELRELDIREVIAHSVESIRPLLVERNQTLTQNILAKAMMVNADAVRLAQVFINLLTNAAKYSPEGGNIEIRASEGAGEAWVHIIDDGIGISSESAPHIFELFTRGDVASHGPKEGLGLGLALVKNFVELHGGSVQARSDGPGQGSEFTVRLPLVMETGAARAADAH